MRRLALAIVLGPFAAALLLLLGELLARLLAPDVGPLAPKRYFLEADDESGRRVLVPGDFPPMRNARFRVAAIPLRAPASTVRIVCLGDSTVHGHPFEPPALFADWMQARLAHLVPRFGFEVLNLGANAMSSEAVLDVAREIAPLRPDVVVVYVGHNEFLDLWIPGIRSPLLHAFRRVLDRSHLGRRLEHWLPSRPDARLQAGRPIGSVHDEPLFSEQEIERGERAFEGNLDALAETVRTTGALLVLCLPVCDLLDTPPIRSCFQASTSDPRRAELRAGLRELIAARKRLETPPEPGAPRDVPAEARALLPRVDELGAIDASVAHLDYERGRLLRLAGELEAARAALAAARDRDGYPIRATRRRLETIRRVARRSGALLADPWPLFEAAAGGAIAGQDGLFVDYCHPDLPGHRLLAAAIVSALHGHGAFVPAAEWRFDDEPDVATYESRMGLSRLAQADSLARRGFFLLGAGFLDPSNGAAIGGAASLFDSAARTCRDCAQAQAGLAMVQLMRHDAEGALAAFDRARELDPAALDLIVSKHAELAAVRALFDAAGLTVREGKVMRR